MNTLRVWSYNDDGRFFVARSAEEAEGMCFAWGDHAERHLDLWDAWPEDKPFRMYERGEVVEEPPAFFVARHGRGYLSSRP